MQYCVIMAVLELHFHKQSHGPQGKLYFTIKVIFDRSAIGLSSSGVSSFTAPLPTEKKENRPAIYNCKAE